MAEKRGAAVLYDAKDSGDESKGEANMEGRESNDRTAEREGMKEKDAGAAMTKAEKSSDKFLAAMKGLHKAHETERRDYHGNHREALRQMASRHEKAFRDLVDGYEADDAEGEDVSGTEAAAAADMAMEA